MKLFIKTCVSLCAVVAMTTPASACCWFPFGGWWGAGYNAAPAYSSNYAPSYTSYYGSPAYSSFYGAGSMMAPMSGCCGTAAPAYAASYGSYGAGCCTNSCCDSCGSGGCASGSCVGTEPVGSLKPATDPISNKSKPAYDDEPRTRTFPSDTDNPRPRSRDLDPGLDPLDDTNKKDMFDRPAGGTGRTGVDTDTEKDPFPADDGLNFGRDRDTQKPPMEDPLDGTTIDPVDENPATPKDDKTFIDGTTTPSETSRGRDTVIARTSALSEVIAPKRLASRSLPSTSRSVSSSKVAGKVDSQKKVQQKSLRWISAPLPNGHASL